MKKLFVIAAAVSLIAVAKLGATTVTIDRVNGYYSGNGGVSVCGQSHPPICGLKSPTL